MSIRTDRKDVSIMQCACREVYKSKRLTKTILLALELSTLLFLKTPETSVIH